MPMIDVECNRCKDWYRTDSDNPVRTCGECVDRVQAIKHAERQIELLELILAALSEQKA